jgi:hypothetical protein
LNFNGCSESRKLKEKERALAEHHLTNLTNLTTVFERHNGAFIYIIIE